MKTLPPGDYTLDVVKREIQIQDDGTVIERVHGVVRQRGDVHVISYFQTIPTPSVSLSACKNEGEKNVKS